MDRIKTSRGMLGVIIRVCFLWWESEKREQEGLMEKEEPYREPKSTEGHRVPE